MLTTHADAKIHDPGRAVALTKKVVALTTTTVSGSFLALNEADGDRGGAGLGGDACNDATSTLTLTACLVTQNQADGTPGEGGGVYNLGLFSDPGSLNIFNHASTSGDNIGP
jgi:hypothetical protein